MQELKELLKTNTVTVLFTKRDGTQRKMICTLQESLLPVKLSEDAEASDTKIKNPDLLTVFDLEKNAWRSFRHDSVLEYFV